MNNVSTIRRDAGMGNAAQSVAPEMKLRAQKSIAPAAVVNDKAASTGSRPLRGVKRPADSEPSTDVAGTENGRLPKARATRSRNVRGRA